MKKYLTTLLLITFYFSTSFTQEKDGFKTVKLVKTTAVKDQEYSNACWSFATTSFIETEILRMLNKEIVLSPMYFVYHNYLNQAENYLRMHGQARFSPGGLTFHVFDVLEKHGCVPNVEFSGKNRDAETLDCTDLLNTIKPKLDSIVQCNRINSSWKEVIEEDLKKYLGEVPLNFRFENSTVSPNEFANQFCKIDVNNYVSITSFSHHPFYEKFFLEVPANWNHGEYYNLPVEKFMMVIDSAIYNGYSLVWDGDVSEYPIINNNMVDYTVQVIDLPPAYNLPGQITQEIRQQSFNSYLTTEDHLSHLIGIAQDSSGNKYYILKDSLGHDKFLNGYFLLSEAYVKLKTISVMTHKDVLNKVLEIN